MTVEGDSGGDPEDLEGNGGQWQSDTSNLSHDGDQPLHVAREGHVVATDGDPLCDGDWLLRAAGEGHVVASDNNDTRNSSATRDDNIAPNNCVSGTATPWGSPSALLELAMSSRPTTP